MAPLVDTAHRMHSRAITDQIEIRALWVLRPLHYVGMIGVGLDQDPPGEIASVKEIGLIVEIKSVIDTG